MNIRNFCIIAHIDHGKSTLADRLLEVTNTVDKRQMKSQYLDQLELERERGITIKMAPVRMKYFFQNQEYCLNLIDTPGHPDFGYEVSRALAAVEGAILLVDGTQGIQAQTLSNFYAAQKAGLKIIGVVNKIDLGNFDADKAVKETASLLGVDENDILKVSAKTGVGIEELLEKLIEKIPAPQIQNYQQEVSRALIFDSFYDNHKGIIATIRVFEGNFRANQEVFLIAVGEKFKIKEVGHFSPHLSVTSSLSEGEIGYLVTGIRDPNQVKIGDTLVAFNSKTKTFANNSKDLRQFALEGYKEPKPVVFVSFYPDNPDDYDDLKKSLERLKLNDSSFTFEPDANEVLGRGFKGGFLGKLHFEIILQRLEREFGVKTITSFPSVAYKVKLSSVSLNKENLLRLEKDKDGFFIIRNPKDLPDDFLEIWEPMIRLEIIAPHHLLGDLLQLKEIFRWQEVNTKLIGGKVILETRMPLAELISDFDDKLKSISRGFASFSYQEDGYQKSDLLKLEILVAGEVVPGLSRILPQNFLEKEARKMVIRLKEVLPRQQFTQALQARVRGRIIVRENIPALKKDVTGYLYGGDRTRKMKLWKKQKEGKKKLLSLARVRISPEDFKKILSK